MRIALYQPDIPQNTGTILRLGACLDLDIDLIEPAGFRLDAAALKRAGMDYLDRARLTRHRSFANFEEWRANEGRRLILFTTKADRSFLQYSYQETDILLFGRESEGVPATVHDTADRRLTIPMADGARSLNLAISVAMAATEGLRQTVGWPES